MHPPPTHSSLAKKLFLAPRAHRAFVANTASRRPLSLTREKAGETRAAGNLQPQYCPAELQRRPLAMVRETITLQLGNYANYVGAHFWNYQVLVRAHQATQSSVHNWSFLLQRVHAS